jgi:hypothetical protein
LAAGTSQAAPHVSGLAALIWDYRPEMTWQDVKETILSTTVDTPRFRAANFSNHGIINARLAMEKAKAWVSPSAPKEKVQRQFASLTAAHCTDSLNYGPQPIAAGATAPYLTDSLKDAVHTEWKQEISALGDGKVNMRIEWVFESPKPLKQRFYDAAMKGEPVTWYIEYAGTKTTKQGTWWFSDSEGNADFGAMLKKFESQGTSFSSGNGAWGGATGDVNGNCVFDPSRAADRRKCPSDFYGILDDYANTEATGCSHLYVGDMNAPRHYPSMTVAMSVIQEEPIPSASDVVPVTYAEAYCPADFSPIWFKAMQNQAGNNWKPILIYGFTGIAVLAMLRCCYRRMTDHPPDYKPLDSGKK